MGQIRHFNNGKWTVFTTGEELTTNSGTTNTYYIGPNLSDGIYTKVNPNGQVINLEASGSTGGGDVPKVYKALLTQSGDGTSTQTGGTLTIGNRYAITNYVPSDDFSNVANVVFGTINTTGCEFIAIGTTPTVYLSGSTLTNTSAPVATVLVNTLSGTPVWGYDGVGVYILTLASEFTTNTIITPPNNTRGAFGGVIDIYGAGSDNSNTIYLTTQQLTCATGVVVEADDLLYGAGYSVITIEVYP